MSVPPPATGIPPHLLQEYYRLLGLYYTAINNGSSAQAQQLVQQMRHLMQTQGPSLADTVRQFLQALQPVIRPALIAAGAAWTTVTSVSSQVGVFLSGATVGLGAAMIEMLPMLLIILVLVLLFWLMWHHERERLRRAGYPQAMRTPQDGFPAQSPIAAQFAAAARAPRIGPLEVIEGRAPNYVMG